VAVGSISKMRCTRIIWTSPTKAHTATVRLTWAIQVYLEDNKNEKKSKRSRLLGLSSDSPMVDYFVAQSGPPPAPSVPYAADHCNTGQHKPFHTVFSEGNSQAHYATSQPTFIIRHPSAPPTVCLHGTGGCASCRDGKTT
jgi:hypothetical protein